MALAILFVIGYLPNHFLVFSFFGVLILVLALNIRFYLFLAAKRGLLLYHFYNGISFAVGLANHTWKKGTSPRRHATGLRASGEQR
jgi:hypothetical protein